MLSGPLSEDRIKGSYGIGVGMLLGILRMWLWFYGVHPLITIPLLLVATAIFTYGCCFYIKSKGFSPYFGLVGLFWIPGLILLILFPDRNFNFMEELKKRQAEAQQQKASASAGTQKPEPR